MITGGMIEATRFVEYLYQLMYSIGVNGSVVPNTNCSYYFPDGSGKQISFNPTLIILDACFTALAVHILLSRSLLTETELSILDRLIFLCELTTQRLFALKQCMLQVNTQCYVTKSHMLHVLKLLIEWFGYTGIFDTDIFESLHKYVKKLWSQSSRKLMYFQGKEIITMNRIVHISKMNNNEENVTNKQSTTTPKSLYLATLGYISMKSNNRIWFNDVNKVECNWIPRNATHSSLLPIHPILTLGQLNQLFTRVLRVKAEEWPQHYSDIILETMKPLDTYKKWKLQLLKGVRFIDEYSNIPYIVYSKRDHIITECPGANVSATKIDRFNTIEVRYNDDDDNDAFAPATIFSILRFSNKEDELDDIILLVICWLKKDQLPIPRKRSNLANNIYSYAYSNGNLWLDIITPKQVNQ